MGKAKSGKNGKKCKRYADEGRREKNKRRKALKMEKHLLKCAERREANESKTE